MSTELIEKLIEVRERIGKKLEKYKWLCAIIFFMLGIVGEVI